MIIRHYFPETVSAGLVFIAASQEPDVIPSAYSLKLGSQVCLLLGRSENRWITSDHIGHL